MKAAFCVSRTMTTKTEGPHNIQRKIYTAVVHFILFGLFVTPNPLQASDDGYGRDRQDKERTRPTPEHINPNKGQTIDLTIVSTERPEENLKPQSPPVYSFYNNPMSWDPHPQGYKEVTIGPEGEETYPEVLPPMSRDKATPEATPPVPASIGTETSIHERTANPSESIPHSRGVPDVPNPSVTNHVSPSSEEPPGIIDADKSFDYINIGCYNNSKNGAIPKAAEMTHFKDRRTALFHCYLAANMYGTPIFGVDSTNSCYAASGAECTFDAIGKVKNIKCLNTDSGSRGLVTAYVIGKTYVVLKKHGAKIQSSTFRQCRPNSQNGLVVPVLPKPEEDLPASDARDLLSSFLDGVDVSFLNEYEIEMLSEFVESVGEKTIFTPNNTEATSEFIEEFFNLASNLIFAEPVNISGKPALTSTSRLLNSMESVMGHAASSFPQGTLFEIKGEHIAVEICAKSAEEIEEEGVHLPLGNWESGDCTIPPEYFKDGDKKDEEFENERIAFVSLRFNTTNFPLTTEDEETKNDTSVSLVTDVVSFSTSKRRSVPCQRPIVLSLRHTTPMVAGDEIRTLTCVFWNFSLSPETGGAWSTKGCVTYESNSSHTICHCNHLTSFAVLMRFSSYKNEKYYLVLSVVTYIGVSISIIALLITLGIFLYLSSLHSERTTIHKNLVISVGLAQLVFIAGINVTYDKVTCTVMALLLHFFFLASFMWMLAEGIHLYTKVVWVFTGGKSLLRYFYAIGWGLPVAIVALSAAIKIDGYGTEDFCWLSTEDGLIWAFITPASAVILMNLIILALVVKIVVFSIGNIPHDSDPTVSSQAWAAIKGIVILTPILGVSWLFGLLAVNEHMLVFEFLFTFCNAFQGLFIFLFHCVGSSEVRAAFKRKREISSITRELISVGLSTPMTGRSKKTMPIPAIVMNQSDEAESRKGSAATNGSTSNLLRICNQVKVDPADCPSRNQRAGSSSSVQTSDTHLSVKNVSIQMDQRSQSNVEDDGDSTGSDISGICTPSASRTSLPLFCSDGFDTERILPEVENPSLHIIRSSTNVNPRPFPEKPVALRKRSKEEYSV